MTTENQGHAVWYKVAEVGELADVGASFSNHTGITPKKPTIQVDFDPLALGKFHSVEVPVWGEIGVAVEILRSELRGKAGTQDQRAEVAERWRIWRREKKRRLRESRGQGLGCAAIFAAASRQVPEDAIIAVDVGNNTYSFGRYFECRRGALGIRVEDPEELDDAIARALAHDGPSLVEMISDPELV